MPQLGALPSDAFVLPYLFRCELLLVIDTARPSRSRTAEPDIGPAAAEQVHTFQRCTEQSTVAKTAVTGHQQRLVGDTSPIQTLSSSDQQTHRLPTEVVLLALFAETRLLLHRGSDSRFFHARSRDETHRNGTGVHVVLAMQRQEQAGLQKTQSPLQIHTERRRERIALPEGGRDAFAGFLQTRVVQSNGHKRARTMSQSRRQQSIEQGLFLPIGTGMKLIVCTPVLLVAAQTGQNTGQRRRSDHQQRAYGLAQGTLKTPLWPEHGSPERKEGEKTDE